MGWRNVIISQHAKLSYSANNMIIQTFEGINQIPISDIYILIIESNQAVITTELISQLNFHDVKIVFSDDNHNPCCETVNYYPNNRSLDKLEKQYNWSSNRVNILWTKIINNKIINQINVLKFYNHNTETLENELSKLELGDVSNREAVVARKYFMLLFDKKFSRRDFSPMNAALNYGYSILLSTFNRSIVLNGYLTEIGIHHHSDENNFNLGSDFMEPFRPIVDYWLANKKFNQLTPDIKFSLVELLNVEIKYNGKNMVLNNAIDKYTDDCLNYLTTGKSIKIEVELINEVPNNALNSNV
ncbi:type II CRISPR-associated endonuclease Cas1 [Apilactobacillus micheneri]|uniref:type II CRISPR-associated endonuclease Cas1 n=1 Tax=Apilactobacillus micheneri TaxID=1899430 RepID=UPI001126C791|nr:type II CRISPR-associated endonuclease Cas1 [Apilactobacillus micheneri]TPR42407.1 type II CRISPR-associated endonuclease Cas1 [Apilactobacillus micheneri]TPR47109.1 type II CRISPR-associated endonuclease Cas1 [Apilactobacillus micheneri]